MPSDNPLFPLGTCVATPGALEVLEEAGVLPITLLARHVHGDWGDMDKEDCRANDHAIKDGSRIFSSYNLPTKGRIWVITESSRETTTLLLPSQY